MCLAWAEDSETVHVVSSTNANVRFCGNHFPVVKNLAVVTGNCNTFSERFEEKKN